MHNPALREEPRYQPAPVVSNIRQASILSWLEASGRLVAKDVVVPDYEDVEDLSDLMVGEDDYIDLEDEEEDLVSEDEEEDLI